MYVKTASFFFLGCVGKDKILREILNQEASNVYQDLDIQPRSQLIFSLDEVVISHLELLGKSQFLYKFS